MPTPRHYSLQPAKSTDLDKQESCKCIANEEGLIIAVDIPTDDAKRLVHMANNFPALVTAIEYAISTMKCSYMDEKYIEPLKQALSKAKEAGE